MRTVVVWYVGFIKKANHFQPWKLQAYDKSWDVTEFVNEWQTFVPLFLVCRTLVLCVNLLSRGEA